MNKGDEMKINTPWQFVLVLAILIGIMVLVTCGFQMCWNMGLVPVANVPPLDFPTASYLVGLLIIVGYLVRVWPIRSNISSKEN